MPINLITGYDINRDETGFCKDTMSSCFLGEIRTRLSIRPSIPLNDDSNTEWLYTQRLEE